MSGIATLLGGHGAERADHVSVLLGKDGPDVEFDAAAAHIADHGNRLPAKAGGEIDNREAINKAIDAASKAGGGRVVVPAGVFLTGAIRLKSNVNLHVSKGATLKFATNAKAYEPVVHTRWEGMELMHLSPLIYAYEETGLLVTTENRRMIPDVELREWDDKVREYFDLFPADDPKVD